MLQGAHEAFWRTWHGSRQVQDIFHDAWSHEGLCGRKQKRVLKWQVCRHQILHRHECHFIFGVLVGWAFRCMEFLSLPWDAYVTVNFRAMLWVYTCVLVGAMLLKMCGAFLTLGTTVSSCLCSLLRICAWWNISLVSNCWNLSRHQDLMGGLT